MIAFYGNIVIEDGCGPMLLNCGEGWRSVLPSAGRYESIRHLLVALAADEALQSCKLELLDRPGRECGLLLRIWRTGPLSLDFRASPTLAELLGFPAALLQGAESYTALRSPAKSMLCQAPLYDEGLQRREICAALRSNDGRMHMQRTATMGARVTGLAMLDRSALQMLGSLLTDAGGDPDYGFYCCSRSDLLSLEAAALNGHCKLAPAQGQALSFTRSFADAALDLWDCEIRALPKENN